MNVTNDEVDPMNPWPNAVKVRPTFWCPSIMRESIGGNKLTGNLSRNSHPQSSQLADTLWTDPGLKEWNQCT